MDTRASNSFYFPNWLHVCTPVSSSEVSDSGWQGRLKAINSEIAKAGELTEERIATVERNLYKQREEQKQMKKNIEKMLELLLASAAEEDNDSSKDTSQRRKSTT